MIGPWILPTLFAGITADAAPSAADIVATWSDRQTSHRAADISWTVVRDSRTPEFGFGRRPKESNAWRLRIMGRKWRVDGPRYGVMGLDHRMRPAVSDPLRARQAFHHALLGERLAGAPRIPGRQPIAVATTRCLGGPYSPFGALEDLLVRAPILAARPLLLIDTSRIELAEPREHGPGKAAWVVVERVTPDVSREFWVDPQRAFCIDRMFEKEGGRVRGRLDLDYQDAHAAIPGAWTAVRYDEVGNPIEFARARRTATSLNPTIEDDLFDLPHHLVADGYFDSAGPNDTVRRLLRTAIDWGGGMQIVLPVLVVAIGWLRWKGTRRNRPGSLFARTLMVALLGFGGVMLLRGLPLCDPSLREAHCRLLGIWAHTDITGPFAGKTGDRNSTVSMSQLRGLADMLEQCLQRRREGLWPAIAGRDEAAERAWLDLLRVARHDLPERINSTHSASRACDRAVAVRLAKIGDHLAGLSPYHGPATDGSPLADSARSAPYSWFGWMGGGMVLLALGAAVRRAGTRVRRKPP